MFQQAKLNSNAAVVNNIHAAHWGSPAVNYKPGNDRNNKCLYHWLNYDISLTCHDIVIQRRLSSVTVFDIYTTVNSWWQTALSLTCVGTTVLTATIPQIHLAADLFQRPFLQFNDAPCLHAPHKHGFSRTWAVNILLPKTSCSSFAPTDMFTCCGNIFPLTSAVWPSVVCYSFSRLSYGCLWDVLLPSPHDEMNFISAVLSIHLSQFPPKK